MKVIDKIYVNGVFIKPEGTDFFNLVNPVNQELLGKVVMANKSDTRKAIAAAKKALEGFSLTTASQRVGYLNKLHKAVEKRKAILVDTMVLEFGGPRQFSSAIVDAALNAIGAMTKVAENFKFEETDHLTTVRMQPVGVVGIITPWNASYMFILNKLATAVAAGCTVVIKPSEMSAMQTEIVLEAIDEVGFPPGVVNVLNGYGNEVGEELSLNKDVNKISFTGSTVVGKAISQKAVDTMKRITLELGGKSPNIILDDANFEEALVRSLYLGLSNSGQICTAATRILVPENKIDLVKEIIKEKISIFKADLPNDPNTVVGPLVSVKQYERVQEYIQIGINEGAEVLVGGLGHPEGFESGNFVKPTIFVNVNNKMRVAQEEIFGPVLCIITYKTVEEAITIANDTAYGLAAYVQGEDRDRINQVVNQIDAGYITVNAANPDPLAPFGGFKQSGIGREFGKPGLSAYLEIKTILR
ncbi:aldehyde dehydrogenase family protein [Sphingobacterium sp. SYP-B4668]|uniref:aldehyde dehydrogenase family protein n=1 Tax=Sphingobacterium sp. SYP-B4668 TaxID=2996035 RepID=UPI0022DE25E6|nr:aldehyde dehydrogenase family protein [Sphingobacterium sp. SYP-B4668]